MSAPSIAFSITPSVGPVAARVGASTDGDVFAGLVEDAGATTETDASTPAAKAPVRPSAPAKDEAETAPANDDNAGAEADPVVAVDATLTAALPSIPFLGPVAVSLNVSVEVTPPAEQGKAEAEAAPQPALQLPVLDNADGQTPAAAETAPAPQATSAEVAPEGQTPVQPKAEAQTPLKTAVPDRPQTGQPAKAPVETLIQKAVETALAPLTDKPAEAPEPVSQMVETPKAPAAAPTPTTALPPVPVVAPRPAKPAAEVSVTTEVTAEGEIPAEPTTEDAAPPSDLPRLRDVIERAQADRAPAGRTDASGKSAATDAQPTAPTDAKAAAPASTAAETVTAARPASTLDAATAAPTAPLETPIAVAQGAPAPTSDTRPVEIAASANLSTLSRASIETTAQIAAQIVRKLEGRSTRFEMALTPDDLGQVDVSLKIDADGKLAARLAFDNPLAATELRGRVDELRRQLQEAGFTVADDALSFTDRDPASSQGGSAFDQRHDQRSARAFGAASRLEADADRLVSPARWVSLALTPDRVDMKV